MKIKIETVSLPVKQKKETRGRKPKYPVADLKVGQSFRVMKDGKITRGLLLTVINQFKRNHDKDAKFEIKENPKSFRVFKIA